MKSLLAVSNLLLGVVFLHAQVDAGDKAKESELQGSWVIVSSLAGGQTEKDMIGARITFDGGKLSVKKVDIDRIDMAGFRVDPSQKPKHIEFRVDDHAFQGIYELSGDNLKICFNPGDNATKRPTEFESKKDSKTIFAVLKRDKK